MPDGFLGETWIEARASGLESGLKKKTNLEIEPLVCHLVAGLVYSHERVEGSAVQQKYIASLKCNPRESFSTF